jgi:phosphatidylserine decarboxylase
MLARLGAWLMATLPQHGLSRCMHGVARWHWRPAKRLLIHAFCRYAGVDLAEAAIQDRDDYPSLNALFTRALATGQRPVEASPEGFVSPIDGELSEFGDIKHRTLIQAKGQRYDLSSLLAGDERLAAAFEAGRYATLYLSPKDYHRVHMPVNGELEQIIHVPGRLFGVSAPVVRHVPRVFARNERVITVFETAFGPMAMVLIGAIGVGSIETIWTGEITPPRGQRVRSWDFRSEPPVLAMGAEMGRFNLGSTVILLLPPDAVDWAPSLATSMPLRMGEPLGRYHPRADRLYDSGALPVEGHHLGDGVNAGRQGE